MKPQAPTSAPASLITRLAQTQPRKMQFVARTVLIAFLFAFALPALAQQEKIDSLLKVLQTTKADTSKVKLLHSISIEYLTTSINNAMEYAKQGLVLSEKIGYKNGQSICLNALGRAYKVIGKLDSAMVCYEKRLIIAKELKDSIGIAAVYLNTGILFVDYGDYEKAIVNYEKAIRIYASRNEKKLLAKGYINMGGICMAQTNYQTALEYYLKAYDLCLENNSSDLSVLLSNISRIYGCLKQYDKAKQYALDAKANATKSNNLIDIGDALIVLSNIYMLEDNFESAIRYLKEAKVISEKNQSLQQQINVMSTLGNVYKKQGNYEKALEYFSLTLPLAQKAGYSPYIAGLYASIGVAYLNIGDFRKAREYMIRSEKLFEEFNNKLFLIGTYENEIILYASMNQPDSVKKYLDKYKQLQDTIYSEQTSKSIAEMQTKYETEKKDKEILALNLDAEKKKNTVWAVSSGAVLLLVVSGSGFVVYSNRKRREQAILLQTISETDMKALRSQMNPHFIFNCIHTINRLLNGLKIEESKACLGQFSNLTRSVLENSKKREIPLSDELETLRLYMDLENMRFARPFQYSIVIAPGIDQETTLIPPLILQPFVENAIKHGFRDPEKPGQLNIAIRAENGSLICTVEDNGVGRANTVNIHPVSGFKKESLGIKLTEERLKLISRTKKVNSWFSINDLFDEANNPAGTLVEMVLPYELSV